MNLTRVLQPYVCCLGNPVAGNPTQFVMYRAARACGVDWRFFTSQVEVDQFETAFHGVQALGLSGMALFDPFQTKALSLLDSLTESAMCLGRVNVARQDGNSWLGDNTLGTGIIQCLKPLFKTTNPMISPESSMVENARHSAILVVDNGKIAKAMRLASPELAEHIFAVQEGLEASTKQVADERNLTNTKESWEFASFEEFAKTGSRIGCLVLSNAPNANLARQISALTWNRSASCLILANTSEKQMRQFSDSLKVTNLTQVEPVELMAHQAAADFYFWTGVMPAIDLIRDSLEEYLQW